MHNRRECYARVLRGRETREKGRSFALSGSVGAQRYLETRVVSMVEEVRTGTWEARLICVLTHTYMCDLLFEAF